MKWKEFHTKIKKKFLETSPETWWGDDLDVRFFFLKKLTNIKQKKILDVGCNGGIGLFFLDRSNALYGIDIDQDLLEKAKQLNPDAKIIKSSMDNLPFEENAFDIVSMMNVLPGYDFPVDSAIEEMIDKTFSEVARVLKPNGVLYFSTPNGKSLHYKNSKKIHLDELQTHLDKYFFYKIKGWNSLSPLFHSKSLQKYWFIPPRILANFETTWRVLIRAMDKYENSKYFYLEAKLKGNN